MLNRHFSETGIHPALGYLLALVGIAGFSFLLFAVSPLKDDLALYLYPCVAIGFVLRLGEHDRNEFLSSCFPARTYYRIRVLENIISVSPFFIFLCFQWLFIPAAVLLLSAALVAFARFKKRSGFTIPTPFYKRPFEFITGFRKTFYLFFFAYFLTIMSVVFGNFNLGVFSLILVFGICLSYYASPENEFFVWVFHTSPQQFILRKTTTAFLFASMLGLPVMFTLLISFTTETWLILLFQLIGYLYLLTIVLAKYAAYPRHIDLPQAIVMSFAVWFPPLLLIIIPYFYVQALQKLKEVLV